MFKCSQKVILVAICLATITAYPQYNNGCNILQINETESINNNNRNSELNQNVKKCPKTNPNSSSDSQQNVDGKSLSISNIFISHEPDLNILSIPYKNNDKTIEILNMAIKSLNNNTFNTRNKTEINFEINDKENIEKELNENLNSHNITTIVDNVNATEINLQFNEADFKILNIPYRNSDKTFEMLSSVTKSLINKENNKENKSEINLEFADEEKIENKLSKSLLLANKTIDLNKTFQVNTMSSNTTPSLPSSDILLSEIANLSRRDDRELMVGQKIQFQRSNMNSDIVNNNSAGVEILKDITDYCGSQFGKRISFANMTTLLEFPWTVLLLYNTTLRYHCGGSLITTKYVLTAAHCVAQEFYELSGVRLGEHDISENPDCAPDLVGENICATTIDVDVIKIIIHHAYSHMSFKNDIALLRLDKDYISRSYYPICLPSPDRTFNGREAIVAGWGATEKTIRSAVLLKANVPIIDISKCREIYRYSVFDNSTEMCGSGVNEIDVCKGDSGGAIFYQNHTAGKDKYYQLGIISLGVRQCGDKRFLPAVFTKIMGFYTWIENNLEY